MVIGFAIDETGEGGQPPADSRRRGEGGMARAYLVSLPADRFPHLVELAEHIASADADERFELLLDIYVDGLAQRAVRRQRVDEAVELVAVVVGGDRGAQQRPPCQGLIGTSIACSSKSHCWRPSPAPAAGDADHLAQHRRGRDRGDAGQLEQALVQVGRVAHAARAHRRPVALGPKRIAGSMLR